MVTMLPEVAVHIQSDGRGSVILDLRKNPVDTVIQYVERALSVERDQETTIVRKRRSIGFSTSRNTFVRVEARPVAKITGQGWNGVEAAAILEGISKPEWYRGTAWKDTTQPLMWRADETELITSLPIKPGGTLTTEPTLTDAWWATLNTSLDALAQATTTRVATSPSFGLITQEHISSIIHRVFPDVNTTIDEWVPAHADLAWTNLTEPDCFLLDWEDWGIAPRGLDAASLRGESLALPALADRVYRERREDLESRSGRIAQLFYCSKLIGGPDGWAGPLLEPAKTIAAQLLKDLPK